MSFVLHLTAPSSYTAFSLLPYERKCEIKISSISSLSTLSSTCYIDKIQPRAVYDDCCMLFCQQISHWLFYWRIITDVSLVIAIWKVVFLPCKKSWGYKSNNIHINPLIFDSLKTKDFGKKALQKLVALCAIYSSEDEPKSNPKSGNEECLIFYFFVLDKRGKTSKSENILT